MMQRSIRRVLFAVLALCLALPAAGLAQNSAPRADRAYVRLVTTKGDIVLELYKDKAPITVANFLRYVRIGQYDGTIFHRVINDFMIQGGGFDVNMREKPTGRPIKNEANNGLRNTLYTIAMARTADPQSATAQFFINVKNNPSLDHWGDSAASWGYAVFGRVIDGKRVVDAIKGVPTGQRGMYGDVPLTPVIITKAAVISR